MMVQQKSRLLRWFNRLKSLQQKPEDLNFIPRTHSQQQKEIPKQKHILYANKTICQSFTQLFILYICTSSCGKQHSQVGFSPLIQHLSPYCLQTHLSLLNSALTSFTNIFSVFDYSTSSYSSINPGRLAQESNLSGKYPTVVSSTLRLCYPLL